MVSSFVLISHISWALVVPSSSTLRVSVPLKNLEYLLFSGGLMEGVPGSSTIGVPLSLKNLAALLLDSGLMKDFYYLRITNVLIRSDLEVHMPMKNHDTILLSGGQMEGGCVGGSRLWVAPNTHSTLRPVARSHYYCPRLSDYHIH